MLRIIAALAEDKHERAAFTDSGAQGVGPGFSRKNLASRQPAAQAAPVKLRIDLVGSILILRHVADENIEETIVQGLDRARAAGVLQSLPRPAFELDPVAVSESAPGCDVGERHCPDRANDARPAANEAGVTHTARDW